MAVMIIRCDICNRELEQQGALLFNTPDHLMRAPKVHICRFCETEVMGYIGGLTMRKWHYPPQAIEEGTTCGCDCHHTPLWYDDPAKPCCNGTDEIYG